MSAFFVAGTDTDVGKTTVTGLMLQQCQLAGLRAAGLKPVASGAEETALGRRHADALHLMSASNVSLPYQVVNPIALALPASPHIAAAHEGISVSVAQLQASVQLPTEADVVLIEGAGGWLCPINASATLADWVAEANFPVILVVGMRLGCLNHALLTMRAIEQSGVPLRGWVANALAEEMPHYAANVQTLQDHIAAPLLAEVGPHANWQAHLAWHELLHQAVALGDV